MFLLKNEQECFKFISCKILKSIDSIKTYAYGTSKDLVSEKEETKFNNCNKCNNITTQKMSNFDDVTKENIKEHNINLPQVLDHPYIILITRSSRSGNPNALFNLIN